MIDIVAAKLQKLSAWRSVTLSFALGLLCAFAFPPFNFVPVLWVCFPGLFLLVRAAQSWKGAFVRAAIFAFGMLVISLYWIAASMFVDIKSFWWALPFAVAGLPACFSLYYGLAAVLARRWGMDRLDGLFFFAFCWFGADMARAHLFTGFPWDLMGYVWGDCLPVLQITSVIGIHGLTLITVMLAVLPAGLALSHSKRRARGLVLAGVALVAVLWGWGQWRLSSAQTRMVPDVRLRLVQPRTDQAMKWKPEQRLANFQHIMMLTFHTPAQKPVTHYIWPETAIAYYLAEEENVRKHIAQDLPKGSMLLTGIVRRQEVEGEQDRYYNSLIAMDSRGTILAGYDKFHLVPFGEYMPWRSLLSLPVISGMGVDFSAGPGPRTIHVPGLPALSGLICYEAIFSSEVLEKETSADFLLNVTNDAWYDRTIGPAQHYAIVRVRAIEEGMALVRVANAGVTGVVDPYGREVVNTGAESAAVVDSDLPSPIQGSTLMRSTGGWLTHLLSAAYFLVISFFRWWNPRQKAKTGI